MVTRPYVDGSSAAPVDVKAARTVVQQYGGAVHLALEGIEPFSRRGFPFPGVADLLFGARRERR